MNGYTPETIFPEGPIMLGDKAINGKGGPMAICLAYSYNPGAAYLIKQMGVQATIDFAKKCGIVSNIPPYPSIALGSADISLIEMMRVYTMFPGGGYNTTPIYLSRIEDRNGNVLAQFTPKREEVISETDAYIMTKMMQGVVDFGTGRAMRGAYDIQSEIAGKTGTTNDNADGWFIGFSPQLLAGVWVGCDDPFLPLLNTRGGADMAMPAWAYFFQELYKDKTTGIDPNANKPQSLQNEAIMDYENYPMANCLLQKVKTGNGESKDYIDVPVDDGSQKVAPESQLNPEEES
jgi:penicillin-binding protein 1A